MGCGGLGRAGSAAGHDGLKGLLQLRHFCDSVIETEFGVKPRTCTWQEESGFTYSKRDFLSAKVSS